jgi:hypothetical protein
MKIPHASEESEKESEMNNEAIGAKETPLLTVVIVVVRLF